VCITEFFPQLNGVSNSFKMLAVNHQTGRACAALILVISACHFAGCQKKSASGEDFYRFIDLLKLENIQASPLLGKPAADLTEAVYPINSADLTDTGSGENPLGLKRKHSIGAVETNILFSPPKCEFVFDVVIPENGVLDFGIGIVRDLNFESARGPVADEEKGVEFIITLEIKGRGKTIFQKNVSLPPRQESRTLNFSMNKVDLPYRVEPARLSFMTTGAEGAFAYWYNPVLYSRSFKRPNIILVSIDTLRADHLGIYGYARQTSPALDSLAQDGAVFLNTFATSAWTLPSHASMLTSLFGFNHQIYYNDERIGTSLVTLADVLRQNRFFCAAFTGGVYVGSRYGFSKGFDSFSEREGDFSVPDSAERVRRAVTEWIGQNQDKNFFLFLHTYQPHSPYDCPAPFSSEFLGHDSKLQKVNILDYLGGKEGTFKPLSEEERRDFIGLYDGEIRYTDERLIKPLLSRLKQLDLYDRTMVIVTSDHGEEFFDHGGWEHGHTLYNELLKVPLVIKFPDSKFRGKRIESIISLVDVMPTILEEMGIDDKNLGLDGRSLQPLLKGESREDRVFFADRKSHVTDTNTSQRITLNEGRMKLILNKVFSLQELTFYRYPPPMTPPVELYDLREDPAEKKNIADKNTDLARRLAARVDGLFKNARPRQPAKTRITKELEDQLRALGYIH
jgi:arylsulfatase A-like enzyme